MKFREILTLFFIFIFNALGFSQEPPDSAYHDYNEILELMDYYRAIYPDIFYAESLTVSTRDSIPIWAVRISDNADSQEDEPAVLITGCIHAEELVSTEVCVHLMDYLTSLYGSNARVTRWVDSLEIWVIPVVNPEGHNVVTEGLDITYRKNKRDNNLNGIFDFTPGDGGDSDGVDLNRNFDINWEDGEPSMISYQYRGPYAASENEVRAIQKLASREKFLSSIFYHSSGSGYYNEKVIYPYNWRGTFPPDYYTIYLIAEGLAGNIHRVGEIGVYDTWVSLYPNGNASDWLYCRLGTMAYIVEIDTCTIPEARRLEAATTNQLNGLMYLFDRTLGAGIWGHVFDSISEEPLVAQIEILEATAPEISPRFSDSTYGSFFRLLRPGTYTLLVSCDEYRPETLIVEVRDSMRTSISVDLSWVGIPETGPGLPNQITLNAYPNPFNQMINIRYALVYNGQSGAILEVRDIRGALVNQWELKESRGLIRWEAVQSAQREIGAGIYFLNLADQENLYHGKKIIYLK
ncbi:hypothetical protein JW877_04020 [bacterium]|nr:hypothetical protein [bacterium]